MAISNQLRGKKPSKVQKRLKAMFYGVAGSGKTRCAMQFPKPYFIDTERGAENDQYVESLERVGGVLFQTQDYDDIYNEVKLLSTIRHDYKTIVIDPITIIYSNLVDAAAKKVGEAHGKHYNEANKQIKRLLDLLMRLDMNVIITAHSKNEYGKDMAVLNQTFDAYKKLDYMFDLVIELKKSGKIVTGVVKKSRIEKLAEFDAFDFSYEAIMNKYDTSMLEKAACPIDVVSMSTLNELQALITQSGVSEEWVDRCKAKALVSEICDFTEEQAASLVKCLKTKIGENNVAPIKEAK